MVFGGTLPTILYTIGFHTFWGGGGGGGWYIVHVHYIVQMCMKKSGDLLDTMWIAKSGFSVSYM